MPLMVSDRLVIVSGGFEFLDTTFQLNDLGPRRHQADPVQRGDEE
jgi:hypothetical protein